MPRSPWAPSWSPAVSVIGNPSAADLNHTAEVDPATTFQRSNGCSLPGVLNVDPQGVAGPDETDPALRIGHWQRTVYISCVYDATGDGIKYRVYVNDRDWTGQGWITKTTLRPPAPGTINDRSIHAALTSSDPDPRQKRNRGTGRSR